MKVLLITPPMTQLNTPYPATAYLTGFLRDKGISCTQADFAIELILDALSKKGLEQVRDFAVNSKIKNHSVLFFLKNFEQYSRTVESTIAFSQGKNPKLSRKIVQRNYLPEGPRFDLVQESYHGSCHDDYFLWAKETLGAQDFAKHLATLYIDDLADVICYSVDSRFTLSRYGEKLAASQSSFDDLKNALDHPPTFIDTILESITLRHLRITQPDVVGITAPFPGNVYGALRIGKIIHQHAPNTKVIFGGGYANTELRSLKDPRIFECVDFITLDDGERPLLCILEYLQGKRPLVELKRTLVSDGTTVQFHDGCSQHDFLAKDCGTPTYEGLQLDRYLSLIEMLNPMHRLWSEARWNKITIAHGCYWKKCTFCDVSLDYIGRYDLTPIDTTIARIESLIEETGFHGFHFVDEAAPPAALRTLSEKILDRKLKLQWWGNIRFEKSFTSELTMLMAQAGCIAVTGGLEVASERLLKLINKGVTLEQVARVTRAFRDAGILVHAYLMYGFPTQTETETIDSLEFVRQLFAENCIQSAFWHRFSATVHSPVGKNPDQFEIKIIEQKDKAPFGLFAQNDLVFVDPTGCNHERLGRGLNKAVYNFMHGMGLEEDVRVWFEKSSVQ